MRIQLMIILVVLTNVMHGQEYYEEDKAKMQFFGLSYGVGTNEWSSVATNYKLWDQTGIQILDGNSLMKASSHSEFYGLQALFPIRSFRFGFGFNFERIALTELKLETDASSKTYGFPEIFRADKIFISIEKPYKMLNKGKGELFMGITPGMYSFSMIRSTSLFGETRSGRKMFLQLSHGYEYHIRNKVYANVRMLVDYKFFRNYNEQFQRSIQHNIFTFGISAGLRLAFR